MMRPNSYRIGGRTIETMRSPDGWIATLDNYDGAPDADPDNRLIGWNRTDELAAVNDLLDYLDMDNIATLEQAA